MLLTEGDDGGAEGGDGEKKKRQTRGGRGVIKTKQKQDIEKKICLSRSCRGKKKYVTIVTGLSTYGEFCSQLFMFKLELLFYSDCPSTLVFVEIFGL